MLIAAQPLSRQFLEIAGRAESVFSIGCEARQYGRGVARNTPALNQSLLPHGILIPTVSCKARRTLEPVRFTSFATGNTSRLEAALSRALGLVPTPFTRAVRAEQGAIAGRKWSRLNQTEPERYALLLC
jgi:hypothetical protein